MTKNSDSLLLTLKEAARMLSMSERKISQLVADGVLPSLKIDRCRRFSVKALEKWIEAKMGEQQ